jgi:hypothetical protein
MVTRSPRLVFSSATKDARSRDDLALDRAHHLEQRDPAGIAGQDVAAVASRDRHRDAGPDQFGEDLRNVAGRYRHLVRDGARLATHTVTVVAREIDRGTDRVIGPPAKLEAHNP